ncbi:peptidase family M48-domain-containing protein [Mycena albidolilacea]|uniref:Peptidase family M48-domain-containing protein n=1 Tax=Mycena albidolilacea TaxID=1033008 RepID=A0AAD6Z5Z4_9AGAR|nr:peptidase family M48-domain-containing protein [Mycena albidolilacea]
MKAFSRVLRAQQKPWTGSRVSTRFYSPRPSGGPLSGPSRPLLDRNSGTLLGVTAGLLLGGFYVSHLETAPESGRRRFMAVSKRQEELLRTQALQETRAQFRGRILPLEHPLTQQVRRITRRIIVASNLGHLEGEGAAEPPELIEDPWGAPLGEGAADISRPPTLHPDREWAVLVVDDPSFVNAFAAAGLVCVSTGIMPIARNEEGLAAIIGHEIGHVAMRHPAELLSQSKILLPVMVLLAFIGLDFGLSSVLTNVLHSLPHSRALETEADTVGLKLMSRACYDPAAAPRVFEDMSRLEKGSQVPSFFRTHPPTADRVAHLKTLLPESYNIYNANPECVQLEEMRARGLLRRVRMNVI